MEGSAPLGVPTPAPEQAIETDIHVSNESVGMSTAGQSSATGEAKARKAPPEQRRRCMSDKFMLYTYKIKLCKRQDPHNWRLCPYAHPGEAGRRRPPHTYQAVMCDFNKTRKECSHGDKCPLARNALEYWLHPDKYRTIMCGHGEACTRNICFFAHNPTELRNPATAGVDDPLAAELAAATGPFQQLAIGPQLTAGSSSSGSQQPQLVYAEPGGACSIGSGAASSSGAAMTALQASQALQAVQVVGIAGQQQQQVLFPTPAAASDSLLQPTMVPAAGTPGYQQHTSSVMPTGPGIMTLAASQQAPQQSGQALQWGYEQPQLQQQMMLGAAGLHSAVAMQPQVGTAGGSVFAQAAGMGPAVVQQQIMPAPGVPYYSMPGAGYPMMFGQAVPQQQYPQSQYAQQAYPQQQQQQQQVYYPHQATMLMMPQANQPAGPGSGVAARYIPAVGAVDQPVVSVLQPSTGVGHLTGRPGPVMQMYTPPGPAQLSQQHPQQLAGGSATPPASAAEQQYLVPHW